MDPKEILKHIAKGAHERKHSCPQVYDIFFENIVMRYRGQAGLPKTKKILRRWWDEACGAK